MEKGPRWRLAGTTASAGSQQAARPCAWSVRRSCSILRHCICKWALVKTPARSRCAALPNRKRVAPGQSRAGADSRRARNPVRAWLQRSAVLKWRRGHFSLFWTTIRIGSGEQLRPRGGGRRLRSTGLLTGQRCQLTHFPVPRTVLQRGSVAHHAARVGSALPGASSRVSSPAVDASDRATATVGFSGAVRWAFDLR